MPKCRVTYNNYPSLEESDYQTSLLTGGTTFDILNQKNLNPISGLLTLQGLTLTD